MHSMLECNLNDSEIIYFQCENARSETADYGFTGETSQSLTFDKTRKYEHLNDF